MSGGVLIIEDEAILAKKMAKYLAQNGYQTRVAGNGQDGLKELETFNPEAVLLDFCLPGGLNGLEILERIRLYDSSIKIVLITGEGSIRLAVDAMKKGAYDYLSKPVILSGLKTLLNRAIGQNQKGNPLSYYQDKHAARLDIEKIIGKCAAIHQIKTQIEQITEAGRRLTRGTPPPVLITGETGTGKELVARALHFGGSRSKGPFVELNLATIPSHLVESELFGYERGAFTDARERRLGLVESADGGTLFLDEIGELELSVQAKLLKLLEDYNVRRLGSVSSQKVDIQIISATNRHLADLVAEGKFRDDLLFRLNTMTLKIPPLRERGGDIIILARHFVTLFMHKYDRQGLELAESGHEKIMRHSWPGNVRELRNTMEQAVLLCQGQEISAEHLTISENVSVPMTAPSSTATLRRRRADDTMPGASHRRTNDGAASGDAYASYRASGGGSGATLQEAERDLVRRALNEVGGNVSKAARRLGISRDQMRYRIEKYDLSNDN